MSNPRAWGDAETEILRNNFRLGGIGVVRKLAEAGFTRTPHAVQQRACRLGISLSEWSDEELDILRQHGPRGVLAVQTALAEAGFERADTQIYGAGRRYRINIAVRWGLSTRSGWTEEEDDILKRCQGKNSRTVQAALQDIGIRRTFKSIRTRARHLRIDLVDGHKAFIWSDEEVDILRRESIHGPYAASVALADAGFKRTPTACSDRMSKLKLRHRVCPQCGGEYNIRSGCSTCPFCSRQNRPGLTDVSAMQRGVIEAEARRTMQLPDPWKSGEIPQRPWYRTPDPQLGF